MIQAPPFESIPLPSVTEAYRRITGRDPLAIAGDKRVAADTIAVPCVSRINHKHGDANPSLHIRLGADVWTCRVCPDAGGKSTHLVVLAGLANDLSEASKWLCPPEVAQPKALPLPDTRRLVATYPYTDADGKLLLEVQRFAQDLADGTVEKDFKQRRPTPGGAWLYSIGDVPRVPYRWPEILAAIGRNETIYVVEGEKDANTGWDLGLAMTTTATGSKTRPSPEFVEGLRGASNIVVIGDNDDAGAAGARVRAEVLSETCGNVRLVERMPGVSHKGDLTDWVEAFGKDKRALKRALAAVAVLVGGDIDDGSMRAWSFAAAHDRIKATQKPAKMGMLTGIRSLDVALYGLQPGRTTVLAARSGHGKTSVAHHIMGNVWHDYKVLFVSLEMGIERTHDTIAARAQGLTPQEYRLRGRPELDGDAAWYAGKKFHIIGKSDAATADAIIEKVEYMRPDLLVVDHLREVAGWHDATGKVRSDIGPAIVMSKLISAAIKFGHHNLLLSQVGRDAEGGRPELSDLRDSGSVEEKADNVIMLYRPHKSVTKSTTTDGAPEDDTIEVILRKAREAEEMITMMKWHGAYTSIEQPDTIEEITRVRRHLVKK